MTLRGPSALINANYFDGRSAKLHRVSLDVQDGIAHVSGDGIERSAPLRELRVSEPLGKAPRLITFADGAFCEVRDHAALNALLATTGYRDRAVVRWQRSFGWVAAMLVAGIAIVTLAYRYALPAFAEAVAERLPPKLMAKLGEHTLAMLDQTLFKPSTLPGERQSELIQGFQRLVIPDPDPLDYRVVFRSSKTIGANAFALPSGTIVVTDQLAELAKNDREVYAVLAHELGHLHRRHALRQVLQSSVVALAITWYIGDVSSMLASAPVALIEAKYSRDLEREADVYAARMLKENALSPALLATMLERLEAAHTEKSKQPQAHDGAAAKDYLSTHPATEERLRYLREL
jgi:Zn-dependent protease with chaperone function